ncbi:MAG: hypothetical protein GY790_15100 [Bacteroidetes bacterium]|nr:hypothetical protein [Bacteroidota bacterium]
MALYIRVFFTVSFILISSAVLSRQYEREVSHNIMLKPQFLQIKDGLNYGLVHKGLDLAVEYARGSSSESNTFIYSAEIGFGANYRQGIGMAWSLTPVDLYYGFRLNQKSNIPVTLGPYIAAIYNWQLYPELQSGHMLWFSSYELGPQLLVSLPVQGKMINFELSGSLASFNSRPEPVTEQYYYSLTFSDFVKNPHSNMEFGSLNQYGHIHFIAQLLNPDRKLSVAYEFEFFTYVSTPSFKYMTHSITLNWKLGKT